ncbi:hypothetical protein KEM52_004624, partial [Ascosphaera acerosa]
MYWHSRLCCSVARCASAAADGERRRAASASSARATQSASSTSHMNSNHSAQRAQRAGCSTAQLKAQPTACQKSSARDQTDWCHASGMSGTTAELSLPASPLAWSARPPGAQVALHRREESKWVIVKASARRAASGPAVAR